MKTMKKKLVAIAIGVGVGMSFVAQAGQCCNRLCTQYPAEFQAECFMTCVETSSGFCYLL